ncbi:type 1 glutamine amidotransferase domain-containing protein [Indiicoccus explosivorum]|uniref:type 1 glutamine amidotransferase domain-containing protein n=1 Tax=Indiicoccus explosivorum TaxID=1917864 RepID=UPI0013905024|nr:type 1 glutamine amidotransferase domain-containing protein [Indiicoccus explosivorum]
MKRVLAVVTNAAGLGEERKKTGLWFSELTGFYDVISRRYPVDVVSTSRQRVPIDPKSLAAMVPDKEARSYYLDDRFMKQLWEPRTVEEIAAEDYAAVYFAGGHGAMEDFPANERLKEIIRTVYENGGVVSAVCHGPAALLDVKLSDGSGLLNGHVVSGFADIEEKLIRMYNHLPFSLEQRLKAEGTIFKQSNLPFGKCVAASGRVITGQNPASVKGVARRTASELETVTPGLLQKSGG